MWQTLVDELEPHGMSLIAVALDDSVEAIREWVEAAPLTYTNLLDTDHVVAERFGMVNVPATVWIDEDGTVVRPYTIAPGSDMFAEFSKVYSGPHHDALRRWVLDGELPMTPDTVRDKQLRPSPELQAARAERRLASWLHRHGRDDEARVHYGRAAQLSPLDWTIRRGSMPATGVDPFGAEFFAFVNEWTEAGSPGYET